MESYRRLGFFYEALFNLGLLKALKQQLGYSPLWVEPLKRYNLIEYALSLFDNPTPLLRSALSRLASIYFLQGYTFTKGLLEPLLLYRPELFFYYGKPVPVEDEIGFFRQRFEENFGVAPRGEGRGELTHADTVLHLTLKGKKEHFIAVLDLSLSGAKGLFKGYEYLKKPEDFEQGLSYLMEEDLNRVGLNYIFKPLNFKAGGNFEKLVERLFLLLTSDPQRFASIYRLLTAKNREVAKLLQASSYAYGYLTFLTERGIIDPQNPLKVRIFGISLHKVAHITLPYPLEETLKFLKKAKEVYTAAGALKEKEPFEEQYASLLLEKFSEQSPPQGLEIEDRREGNIQSLLYPKRGEKTTFLLRENWNIGNRYRLNDRKREKHKEVFKKVLETSRWVADLGVPGIGKTSTLFELFEEESLILYTSPRVFLNQNLIAEKVGNNSKGVAFLTTSEVEEISYLSGDPKFTLPRELVVKGLGKVRLKPYRGEDQGETSTTVEPIDYNTSAEKRRWEKGVLNRLFKTLEALLSDRGKPLKGKQLVATFTTQAVVKTVHGTATSEHIARFFAGKFWKNPAFGRKEVEKRLKELLLENGIRNVVFVMDEITGSESGRFLLNQFFRNDWFDRIADIGQKLGLNFRFALLDASLKGFDIFKTFVEDDDPRPLIYVESAERFEEEEIPVGEVLVKGRTFKVVDAFGFPASGVKFFYHFRLTNNPVKDKLPEVFKILKKLLRETENQIFLYAQDKRFLEKLKKEIVLKGLLKEEQIRLIHSLERSDDKDHQKVKLIMATSSAARGVTFPLVDRYLILVPDFAVENNLTELVQALFRGRGSLKTPSGKKTLEDDPKEVHFLLFTKGGKEFLQKLELVLLVKSSLLTVTAGGSALNLPLEGKKVLKIVPAGVQREKVFHPLKEFEHRYGEPLKVLRQLYSGQTKARTPAWHLYRLLTETLERATFYLPKGTLSELYSLIGTFERSERVEDYLKLSLPSSKDSFEPLTVKGHNYLFLTRLRKTRFTLPKEVRKKALSLLGEIEKLEPQKAQRLKPLKDFLLKGRDNHIDLSLEGVERVLLIPPLAFLPYDNLDPKGGKRIDWSQKLGSLLELWIGDKGNFYPTEGAELKEPFGITDLDKEHFDEVGPDWGTNVFLSSELNLLEFLL